MGAPTTGLDLCRTEARDSDSRIFPETYAPVMGLGEGSVVSEV